MCTCTYISIIIDLLINNLMTHKVTHQQPPSPEPAQPVTLYTTLDYTKLTLSSVSEYLEEEDREREGKGEGEER